jgi:hypothetical protein
MTYPDNDNFTGVVVYLIAHAPIAYADSPNAFFAFHFEASGRSRFGGKCRESSDDAVLDGPVEAF